MFNRAWNVASYLISTIDANLEKFSPSTIIVCTFAATLFIQNRHKMHLHYDTKKIKKNLINRAIRCLEATPIVGPKIAASVIYNQANDFLLEVKNQVDQSRSEWKIISKLPDEGLSEEEIKERFKNLQAHYKAGRLSGAVYAEYDEKVSSLLQFVWSKTALTNPMHSEWPLINFMEAEVIAMCQHLLHGEPGGPGIMTHGGSTSILEACKAYVFQARKKGIEYPEIIVPDSIHVSFDKAAKILNAKIIKIPVDAQTGAADVKRMEKSISKHTCMMVGSAPSYPFGIIDPISELGKIASKYHIPLHVDACLGGFITVFANDAGFKLPPCDFSVPGVTSISIDTHKYGQTPKGTSVLLFNQNSLATPTHVHLDWVGGTYVTPGIDGSRSGADIATAWTVLCHKGKREYVEETKKILTLQRALVKEIKKINGIYVPYNPQLSVIPIQSDHGINSLLITDRLENAGWSVNSLQTPEQKPAGFHFCLTSIHANQKDFFASFLKDLSDAVIYAKSNPNEKPKGKAKVYGALKKGVPEYVQDRIGKGYAKILGTLPGISIPGIWTNPNQKELPNQKEGMEQGFAVAKNPL